MTRLLFIMVAGMILIHFLGCSNNSIPQLDTCPQQITNVDSCVGLGNDICCTTCYHWSDDNIATKLNNCHGVDTYDENVDCRSSCDGE